MKVLCDVHISHKIVKFLSDNKIESIHVNDILDSWFTKDKEICIYADEHDFIVFTKDSDFRNTHFISKTPKKLIKLSLGNIPTINLIGLLKENLESIKKIGEYESFIIEIESSEIIYTIHK